MIGSFSDNLNLWSTLTARKVWNGINIYKSFHASRIRKHAEMSGLPVSISIEPTTSCNLRCPECPSGLRSFTRPTGMLGQHLFHKVIDELSPTLSYLTFYFQGEPYLNPDFLQMVKYASSKGIYTATSTNGHYLSPERAKETVASGLNRIIISIDGTTQETYESYRVGGKLEKVIEGTRNIIHARKVAKSRTMHVVFQFLVVRPNEHQIADVRALARTLGVDQVVLKTAQIYDYKNGSDLMPENENYSRYRKNASGNYIIKNAMLSHCWKMWHSCVVTWDGKVVPCCFDKDAHFVLGDLHKSTFREIWFGEKYREFRRSLLNSRSEIEICQNCTEGTKVWA